MFSKSGRIGLSASLVPAALGLYRMLLLQFFRNTAVIIRYAGPRRAVGRLARLLCGTLPLRPLLMPLRFLAERDNPDPFIPPQRTPVPEHVAALLAHPAPLVPLTHPGVMRLQEAICRRELSRRLDLLPEPGLDPQGSGPALGRFGGVDRVLSSLITVAGGRRALASSQELAHRLQVVLPLFMQILGMQGSAELNMSALNLPERIFRRRRDRRLERKKRQFLTFSGSLYPEAIEAARGRIVRENRIRRWRGCLHHLEILKEEYRFRLYLAALDLLQDFDIGKDRQAETIERLGWNYDN